MEHGVHWSSSSISRARGSLEFKATDGNRNLKTFSYKFVPDLIRAYKVIQGDLQLLYLSLLLGVTRLSSI